MGLDGPWPLFSLLEFEPFRSHSFFLHSEGFLLFLWLVRFALTSRITGYLSKGGFWVAWLLTPVSWKCPDCALHFAPVSQGSPLPTDVIPQWLAGLVTTPVSRPWLVSRENCVSGCDLSHLNLWPWACGLPSVSRKVGAPGKGPGGFAPVWMWPATVCSFLP